MKSSIQQHNIKILDQEYNLESGKFAKPADGSVVLKQNENSLLATVGMSSSAREGINFFPLMCDFESKYYSQGKMKYNKFNKREGRPTDNSILTARMIDRPLRPLFPKGITNDVQIIVNTLESDGEHSFAANAITAASMAVQLSGIPIEAPVSAVRVGITESGDFFLNPTLDQIETGKLDLIVAGTLDAILMVEAGAEMIDNKTMLEAFAFAHEHIKALCQAQLDFREKFEIEEKTPLFSEKNPEAEKAINNFVTTDHLKTIGGIGKKDLYKSIQEIKNIIIDNFSSQIEDGTYTKNNLIEAFEKKMSEFMRTQIFEKDKRFDGRTADEIRPLISEVGLFSRTHGSGLFQRGDTQSLSITTLAGPDGVITVETPEQKEFTRNYVHHYNFPPYSVGDVRPLRGTGRREIGHGALSERALRYVIPQMEDGFPYSVRVVSEILTCNGSSSMASVCGSTLSLMDAGVPIKSPIAGIAMGLVTNGGKYKVLTDIQGIEDFDGDMDLKVCGTRDGLTALQMDMKIKGLGMEILEEALKKAQNARKNILDNMEKAIEKPREKMSDYAPKIITVQIKEDQIGMIIGKGGETIQGLTKDYEVSIDVEDSGLISITGVGENPDRAKKAIEEIVYEPKEGDVIKDCEVKKITDFGAFVEIAPRNEALVHISEIAEKRVENIHDFLKEGQKVTVKVLGKNPRGQVQLSIKQA